MSEAKLPEVPQPATLTSISKTVTIPDEPVIIIMDINDFDIDDIERLMSPVPRDEVLGYIIEDILNDTDKLEDAFKEGLEGLDDKARKERTGKFDDWVSDNLGDGSAIGTYITDIIDTFKTMGTLYYHDAAVMRPPLSHMGFLVLTTVKPVDDLPCLT